MPTNTQLTLMNKNPKQRTLNILFLGNIFSGFNPITQTLITIISPTILPRSIITTEDKWHNIKNIVQENISIYFNTTKFTKSKGISKQYISPVDLSKRIKLTSYYKNIKSCNPHNYR